MSIPPARLPAAPDSTSPNSASPNSAGPEGPGDHVVDIHETTTYRLAVRAGDPQTAIAALGAALAAGHLDLRDHEPVHASEHLAHRGTHPITTNSPAADLDTAELETPGP